jgi:hypothetical protein
MTLASLSPSKDVERLPSSMPTTISYYHAWQVYKGIRPSSAVFHAKFTTNTYLHNGPGLPAAVMPLTGWAGSMDRVAVDGHFDLLSLVNGIPPALGAFKGTIKVVRPRWPDASGNGWEWVVAAWRGGRADAYGYADESPSSVADCSWIVPTSDAEQTALLGFIQFACAEDIRKASDATARKNYADANPYISVTSLWRLAELGKASGAELFDSISEFGASGESQEYFVNNVLLTYYNGNRKGEFVADLKPYLQGASPEHQESLLVCLCQWISTFPPARSQFTDSDLMSELTALSSRRAGLSGWASTCQLYGKLSTLLKAPTPGTSQSAQGS